MSDARSLTRFQRLALVHASMMAGEATMVVALADTFFFDVDLTAARERILAFLLVSFTPFLLISPVIGPTIDRLRGGRRLVIIVSAAARLAVQMAMIVFIDGFVLFPLVFVALVLQKTYIVSKSALVPSVVRTEEELVEANSKLGLIAGITGAIAVVPAVLVQLLLGSPATLVYGALFFAFALVIAVRLPREIVITAARRIAIAKPPREVSMAAGTMMVLRACAGFTLFQLAFWFRDTDTATVWYALVVAASALGTMGGNALSSSLRRRLGEGQMLLVALAIPAIGGLLAVLVAGRLTGVVFIALIGVAGAIGRLAFESLVQRDVPVVNRGRMFARYETGFQLAWVAAAVLPVVVSIPGWLGFGVVAVAGIAAIAATSAMRGVGTGGLRIR